MTHVTEELDVRPRAPAVVGAKLTGPAAKQRKPPTLLRTLAMGMLSAAVVWLWGWIWKDMSDGRTVRGQQCFNVAPVCETYKARQSSVDGDILKLLEPSTWRRCKSAVEANCCLVTSRPHIHGPSLCFVKIVPPLWIRPTLAVSSFHSMENCFNSVSTRIV